jgi:Zn-dependent peptidase ImmA (M78 family)
MVAQMTTSGSDDGLRFEMTWVDQPGELAAEATRGELRLLLRGEVIWRGLDDRCGFEWTWIELLEFLGDAWPYLMWEEGFPLGLRPAPTEKLSAQAEMMWEQDPEEIRESREAVFEAFQGVHDLSRGLQGVVLPPLWIVREGRVCWLSSKQQAVLRSSDEVIQTLSALGDAIAERLRNTSHTDARAESALGTWSTRLRVPDLVAVTIATGLDPEIQRVIQKDQPLEHTWELRNEFQPNELLAAARMAQELSVDVITRVVEAVRRCPKLETPELDRLTETLQPLMVEFEHERPHDQGYRLATWLRRVLKLGDESRADPSSLLKQWRVKVRELAANAPDLDAFACWGPNHGPGIFINSRGSHNQSQGGVNATLAHEICHLLVDRIGALPLAEVLGGRTSQTAEARARAFAAEFLLPRTEAGRAFQTIASADDVMRRLQRRYRVSQEIVAWQARNSGASLRATTLAFLRRRVSMPEHY